MRLAEGCLRVRLKLRHLGNIAIQVLATGEASSLQEVRAIVDRSFPTEIFEPMDTDKWDHHFQRFEHYCEMTYA